MGSKFPHRFFHGTHGTKHEFGFQIDYKEGKNQKGPVNLKKKGISDLFILQIFVSQLYNSCNTLRKY